jgi:hypothetical protein
MTPTLRLKIEGPPDRVSAEALARALTDSLAILGNVGRLVTGRTTHAKAPLTWYVTKLESASATAHLVAEPAFVNVDAAVIDQVGNGYVDGLRNVETAAALPRFMSDTSLDRLRSLARPLGTPSAEYLEAAWGTNGTTNSIRMTARSRDNLIELRTSRLRSIGSVTGILDAISLRGSSKFQVYDDVFERPVTAEFDRADLERVKDAIGQRVNVSGFIMRNSKGQPVRIEEPHLEIMGEGPRLSTMIGIAPDYLGDLSMREYMEYTG